ncbi:hypothetical protein ACIHCQ_20815 [Streptomyces sp. NPDC052236]
MAASSDTSEPRAGPRPRRIALLYWTTKRRQRAAAKPSTASP